MTANDNLRLHLFWGAIQKHEVGADPTDPDSWSGNEVGVGLFLADKGGLDMSPDDSGNWTGGQRGVGQLGGTKWGIDCASYADDLAHVPAELRAGFPTLVKDLTLAQGEVLLDYAYLRRVRGYDLPPALALLVVDASFNNGVERASRWLQEIVSTAEDGMIGDVTVAAVQRHVAVAGEPEIAASFHALRVFFMGRLDGWGENGVGWSKRLSLLPFQATRASHLLTSSA